MLQYLTPGSIDRLAYIPTLWSPFTYRKIGLEYTLYSKVHYTSSGTHILCTFIYYTTLYVQL